jgi:hypothetical protein
VPQAKFSRRSVTTGLAAAMIAIPAVGLSMSAEQAIGEDAELRQLWADYLDVLRAMRAAECIYCPARATYEAEFEALKADYPCSHGDLHDLPWKKHGLGPLQRAVDREHRKLIRVTKAIRKAKAETRCSASASNSACPRISRSSTLSKG